MNALGEAPVNGLSDVGSTPTASTNNSDNIFDINCIIENNNFFNVSLDDLLLIFWASFFYIRIFQKEIAHFIFRICYHL